MTEHTGETNLFLNLKEYVVVSPNDWTPYELDYDVRTRDFLGIYNPFLVLLCVRGHLVYLLLPSHLVTLT